VLAVIPTRRLKISNHFRRLLNLVGTTPQLSPQGDQRRLTCLLFVLIVYCHLLLAVKTNAPPFKPRRATVLKRQVSYEWQSMWRWAESNRRPNKRLITVRQLSFILKNFYYYPVRTANKGLCEYCPEYLSASTLNLVKHLLCLFLVLT